MLNSDTRTYRCSVCKKMGHNKQTHDTQKDTKERFGGTSPLPKSTQMGQQEDTLTLGVGDAFAVYNTKLSTTTPSNENQPDDSSEDIKTLWELYCTANLENREELANDLVCFAKQFSETYNLTSQKWVRFFRDNDIPPLTPVHSFTDIPEEGFPNSDAFFEGSLSYAREELNDELTLSELASAKILTAQSPAAPKRLLEQLADETMNRKDTIFIHNTSIVNAVAGNPQTSDELLEKVTDHVIYLSSPSRGIEKLNPSFTFEKILSRGNAPEAVLTKVINSTTNISIIYKAMKNPDLPEGTLLAIINKDTPARTYIIAEMIQNQKNITPKVKQAIAEQQTHSPSILVTEALKVREEEDQKQGRL